MSFVAQRHQYAYLLGTPIDAKHLDAPKLMALRHASGTQDLLCGYCKETLALGGDEAGWHFYHPYTSDHQQETRNYYIARQGLLKHIHSLFPSSQASGPQPVGSWWVDILLLTPRGGKLAIVVQAQDWSSREIEDCIATLHSQGITPLWIQLGERLEAKPLKKHTQHRVHYTEQETRLLQLAQPLWYWFEGMIISLDIHPGVLEHLHDKPKLGWVETRLRRYPVSQLRINHGMVAVLSVYEEPTQNWRKLPARFKK